jgi:hypothetical protein
MPVFLVSFFMLPFAFLIIAAVWVRYSLKAKREGKYYLSIARAVAALISFAVADYVIWTAIRIATT